ncbi:DNA-binding transcriptional MerR regulator [Brooklawnia cerclae]|uniref:DNA-binding transcriptional MerR regulator n=1 Tax=Brooklawnia cerclae TaxID=349934 RepID=A0ABX0SE44_9ACTN|nr:DNA-binding transcriptional MerR regulator [Brooklawnia cerclae]
MRTLHHWEQIGLLRPTDRSTGGHRLYHQADVERIYQVCALRELGLPLAQIAGVLDGADLASVVRQHLVYIEGEVARLDRLQHRLRRLASDLAEEPSPEQAISLIEALNLMDRYFTNDQLMQMDRRRSGRGRRRKREVEAAWAEIAVALRTMRDADNDPSSPQVQSVVERARALIDTFTGGDMSMYAALRHLGTQEPPADLFGWDSDLLQYLYQALDRSTSASTVDGEGDTATTSA